MQLISFIVSVMTLFVYQKILCVYVLEKVKTILHFFRHSATKLMKSIFVENGRIYENLPRVLKFL